MKKSQVLKAVKRMDKEKKTKETQDDKEQPRQPTMKKLQVLKALKRMDKEKKTKETQDDKEQPRQPTMKKLQVLKALKRMDKEKKTKETQDDKEQPRQPTMKKLQVLKAVKRLDKEKKTKETQDDKEQPNKKVPRLSAATEEDNSQAPSAADFHCMEECIEAARKFKASASYQEGRANSMALCYHVAECFSQNTKIPEPFLVVLANYILEKVASGLLTNKQLKDSNSYDHVTRLLFRIFAHAVEHMTSTFKAEIVDKATYSIKSILSSPFIHALPIVFWIGVESQNSVSNGSSNEPYYPQLFFGEFVFSDSYKDKQKSIELDFSKPKYQVLKHAMSTSVFLRTLFDKKSSALTGKCEEPIISLKNYNTPNTDDVPNTNTKPCKNLCNPLLLYCTVDIPDEELYEIEKEADFDKPVSHLREKRYGSVVVKFRSRHLANSSPKNSKASYKFFKLGTKKYLEEHAQILLADTAYNEWILVDDEKKTGVKVERISNISEFKWNVEFCPETKSWVHPEIAFPGGIDINLKHEECKVSFVTHQCAGKWVCDDCSLCLGPIEVVKTDNNGDEMVIKLDVKKYGSTSERVDKVGLKITCSAEFARFKFATSMPTVCREALKTRSFMFDEFDKIVKIWEECPNFYYKDWKKV